MFEQVFWNREILKEGELVAQSVCAKFPRTASALLKNSLRNWVVAMLLLQFNSIVPSWADNLPDSQTAQQRQELERMVEASKQQAAHLPPNLETQKQFSERETKQLEKLVDQSEQGLTPILQQEVKALLESEQYKANQTAGEQLAREVLQLPQQPTGQQSTEEKTTAAEIETEGQVLVFVSSSMPIQTLRNYARALVKVKGALVLRGGIDGLRKIGPTMAFSQRVLKVDPNCRGNCQLVNVPLLIDPLLFRQHHITQVPAIIFQPEGIIQGCERSASPPEADIIYGDISLKGALEKLQQLNSHPKLNYLLTKLENSHVTY